MDDYQIEKMLEAARRERKDRSLCEKYDPSAEQVEQLKRFHCNVNIEQLTPFRDHAFMMKLGSTIWPKASKQTESFLQLLYARPAKAANMKSYPATTVSMQRKWPD